MRGEEKTRLSPLLDEVGELVEWVVGIELLGESGLKELEGGGLIGVGFEGLHKDSNLQDLGKEVQTF